MRVLLIGDGIALTSGFAQVISKVAAALVARGDEVAQIASLDTAPTCRSEPYTQAGVTPFFPASDTVGMSVLTHALRSFQPDVIFMNCDPGLGREWIGRLEARAAEVPIVFYSPIEGAPVTNSFCEAFAAPNVSTMLYTDWSARQVYRTSGRSYPWTYHGVDTEVWKPLPDAERASVRDALGWTDSFVISYVGRNCARKAQPVLIDAMAQLQRTLPNARLYLHCQPFDGYWGQGWDLNWLAQRAGVADAIEFPNTGTATRGEPGISLARKLAASDLYVHGAEVEGFGLPILEAMAVGLPVIIPNDDGNMAEVAGDAPLLSLDPVFRSTWFTGAELCHTTADQWARAIHWAAEHSEQRAEASERSLARAAEFSWERMTADLLDAIDREVLHGEPAVLEAVSS